jgi:hypothetical protein
LNIGSAEGVDCEWCREGKIGIGGKHLLNIVVDGQDLGCTVDGVKPDVTRIENEQHHIGQRAWSQTSTYSEVHPVAQLAAFPFIVIQLGWHYRELALSMTTAATCGTHEELSSLASNIDEFAIGT